MVWAQRTGCAFEMVDRGRLRTPRSPLDDRHPHGAVRLPIAVFSGVRLRTNVTKRQRVRENALHLVFKLVCRLSVNWRAITAPNQIELLLAGHRFQDGRLELESDAAIAAPAAA